MECGRRGRHPKPYPAAARQQPPLLFDFQQDPGENSPLAYTSHPQTEGKTPGLTGKAFSEFPNLNLESEFSA